MINRRLFIESLEDRRLLAALDNGDFSFADTDSPDFAWDAVGDVRVVDGQAQLREDLSEITSLRQTFDIPGGAQTLQLTIVEESLLQSFLQPPDAFEIALLDPITFQPFLNTAEGLPGTDALFNLAADDVLFFGSEVSVPGASSSGQAANLIYPLTISIDVSTITQRPVLLSIEVLGFGAVDSNMIVDDVRLTGDLPPHLTMGMDPATDTGTLGDAFTQATSINLVGLSEAGQVVEIDIDGDGFDDGSVVADASGHYRFDGLSLPNVGPFRVRASNSFGESTAERRFILDTTAPRGILSAPSVDVVLTSDPGFLEVLWDDANQSGINWETVDLSDIVVDGVDIDRIERLPQGRIRYWYGDDGQELPYGPVRIRLLESAVRDQAGNPNGVSVERLNHVRSDCAWHNAALPEDSNGDGYVSPLDALIVINELNRRADTREEAALPTVPPAGVPFFWYDVKCDGFIVPLDALIIINEINRNL